MMDWQPTASLDTLAKRAGLLALIRAFFSDAGVMEVDVPVLAGTGVTDLHIDCLQTRIAGQIQYLQSSPEYYMKRVLAAGSGSIYYLGRAFRDGEAGQRHNPEFTMLEWYRTGWDERQLMGELVALLLAVNPDWPVETFTYGQLFKQAEGLDPHNVPLDALQRRASQLAGGDFSREGRSTCLDLIFSLSVEPSLPDGLVLVHDYPACQSALARLDKDTSGNLVARRFEAFLNRMELANGYFELTDPVEQRSRFEADLAQRKAAGKPPVAVDDHLLAALDAGLPECAGVALGVDRLLMQWLGLKDIRLALPFVWGGADVE
ncbi:MAG: EF-P lysine aminoacylase GenX [Gammaproteobacteria bacterium]|nr:MAG: EF-P lysine aminoacylase GenX [Gammaproteobacteria bacterium]